MNANTAGLPRLPACQVCYSRKVKCDSRRPKCGPCSKNGIDCVILDPNGGPPISREYIHELEQRQQQYLAYTVDVSDCEDDAVSDSTRTTSQNLEQAEPVETPSTILQGDGLSFMTLLFTDAEWRKSNAALLRQLADATRAAEPAAEPNQLPSLEDARYLFDSYLKGPQVQNPFLLRQDIHGLFARVFEDNTAMTTPSNRDMFRTFMILANGSVIPHRNKTYSQHPFGYYLTAMQYFDPFFLSDGLEAIQNLLLICRFGIYYHIGTSIWEIIRLCMRLCIEQELERKSRKPLALLDEQLRRRIFWVCYVTDRYSSTTLNRPFAIADQDVSVGLPVEASDDEIIAATPSVTDLDSFCSQHIPTRPNEMSVLHACVRLRKITSQIHDEASLLLKISSSPVAADNEPPFLAAGRVYAVLERITKELEQWRNSAPIFNRPRCLFERYQWYDLLQARETLQLVRKAVDLAPKKNGLPPKHIVLLCLKCAIRTILLYSELFQQSMVTYTRSYFHMMFTAGLSVLFCISASSDLDSLLVQESRTALACCERTVTQMSSQMLDARHYVQFFKAVCLHVFPDPDRDNQIIYDDWSNTGAVLTGHPELAQVRNQARSPWPYSGSWERPVFSDLEFHSREIGLHHALGQSSALGSNLPPHQGTSNFVSSEGARIHNDPLHWGFLGDDALWSVGLGNYVYGDLAELHGVVNGSGFGFSPS
ncbi:fungal-specific transcription factor domain-containing protein [Hypoxylon trugodes]|uniref:fungal-specific transcription factor domain-containing protein n=1 Tax=Hypoxylon trugodes TaxID=326681 RepID=UPI0021938993|nr:fungal-specific transcription factor domain-containing protein [Hypoxylon trugodes]KAI1393109.1 fungal-specific transcription factor domain-containing protein [Hypoxylon trugodes]